MGNQHKDLDHFPEPPAELERPLLQANSLGLNRMLMVPLAPRSWLQVIAPPAWPAVDLLLPILPTTRELFQIPGFPAEGKKVVNQRCPADDTSRPDNVAFTEYQAGSISLCSVSRSGTTGNSQK